MLTDGVKRATFIAEAVELALFCAYFGELPIPGTVIGQKKSIFNLSEQQVSPAALILPAFRGFDQWAYVFV